MMLVDLHMHSTASDGLDTPDSLVRQAAARGLSLIALTDHDGVEGVPQAAATAAEVEIALIPGVELSCEGEREVHLLGYGLDAASPRWAAFFEGLRIERRERTVRIVERLRQLGCDIEFSQVEALAAHSMSRSHIAQALVATGSVSSIKEAFQRYLSPGAPAYMPREELGMSEAICLLRQEGAVPVLAHPGLLRMRDQAIDAQIAAWHDQGLMGVEAHYPRHTPAQIVRFQRIARKLDMLVTGGSDTHGEAIRPTRIGEGMDYWSQRDQDARALWQAVPHKAGNLPD